MAISATGHVDLDDMSGLSPALLAQQQVCFYTVFTLFLRCSLLFVMLNMMKLIGYA